MSYRRATAAAVVAPLFPIFAFATALPALAVEEQAPARSISTSGEAVVYVKPDEVIVNFGVRSFDASLDRAKAQNDEASARLLKAVRALGVEERYVQADALTVSLRYVESNHPARGVEGYDAHRSYAVRLKDVKLFERLTDAALKNGANELSGFQFRTSELRKHRDHARKLAIKACREKADALAAELGAKVGSPRTITEGGGWGYWGGSYGGNRWVNAQQNVQFNDAAPGAAGGDDGQQETMPLGQIAVTATVSVAFDLVVQ